MERGAKDDQTGVSIHTGFPNPANDKTLGELDLNRLLVRNSSSTFLFRLRGHEWERLGIFDGDIAVIDRALDPRPSDLVIWWDEHTDNFAISRHTGTPAGANIWGIVTSTIRQLRKDQ